MSGEQRAGLAHARDRGAAFARERRAVVGFLAVLAAVAVVLAFALPQVQQADPGPEETAPAATPPDAGAAGPAPAAAAEPGRVQIELLVAGDMLLHDATFPTGEQADGTLSYDCFFAHTADEFARADLALIDQETILAGAEFGLSGYPSFNAPQEVGDAEVAAGIDAVLCATNHQLDWGYDGLEASLAYWRERHPETGVLGVAMPYEETVDEVPPFLFEKDGFRIAVLNYTYGLNGIEDPAGAVALLDEDRIARDVQRARAAGAELVIAAPHWGTERVFEPDESQRYWAGVLCDAGVDAIVGGHPHVIQPVEVLDGADGRRVPVFWSVGNFMTGQTPAECLLGGLAKLVLVKDGGGARVAAWELQATVVHRALDEANTVYLLADYTDELAAANARPGIDDEVQPRSWFVDTCKAVLGDSFDEATCTARGALS